MTKLLRDDCPWALTREQAVQIELKRLAERRRQAAREAAGREAEGDTLGGVNPYRARMAAELAALGRGSDTKIAHVARKEIVLPRELH